MTWTSLCLFPTVLLNTSVFCMLLKMNCIWVVLRCVGNTRVASTFDPSQEEPALALAPDNGFVRLCWAAAVQAEVYGTLNA